MTLGDEDGGIENKAFRELGCEHSSELRDECLPFELGLALNPVKAWRVGGNIAALDATDDVFSVKSGAITISIASARVWKTVAASEIGLKQKKPQAG